MVSRRGLLGGAVFIGAGALTGVAGTAGTAGAVEAATAGEVLNTPYTPLAAPHLLQAEQMVQYQRLLAAGYLPDGLAGHWPLDGEAKGADRSGAERPVTPGPAASWTALRAGGELSFDGTSGAYAATASVLDTTAPFTVSAWVRLSDAATGGADLANMYTAVSQDGAMCSRFLLQYEPAVQTWAFKVRDEAQTVKVSAVATTAAAKGVWTHLAGVWDGTEIRLYVDGAPAGSAATTVSWAATQGFNIGRAKFDSAPVNRFNGSIGDVRAYGRALTGDEIEIVSGRKARYNNTYLVGETPSVVWGQPSDPASWVARARCSSFITRVLRQSYPWATEAYFSTHFHDSGPEAADYHDGFKAGAGPRFQRIRKVADLRPGDLISVHYNGTDANNTGHIVMVRQVKGVFTGSMNFAGETQYAVEIIDSTSDPHGVYGLSTYGQYPDTRMVSDVPGENFTGVGIGHMMFYASDATGEFSRYRFSVNTGSSGTYTVAQRPVSAARIV
ncbi:LamG domain-containing protein [Streptomyces formicae]|uniref:LamG domain-containing protein n=1 Tax=Streptomyces formicae TaxID=1616117 RepID=A0ABY3WX14_9ACTN|nr:LamG domain-containing protein [Streptomyces formicae]UNM15357.1 LamG domain-containing protein [Streptomyces formicae]